jgi:hypothetical protein
MSYLSSVARTSVIDIISIVFAALTPEEQDEAFACINKMRLKRIADDEGETARHIRSLLRVAEHVDGDLTPDTYKAARRELIAAGEDTLDINAIIRYFGTWRTAKEAIGLTEVASPLRIEARFRSRLIGKVNTYREEALREALERCTEALGHVPLIAEYEHWRYREIELAKAKGEELWVPSDSPFRRRWGTWEQALEHFGYEEERRLARFEPGRERSAKAIEPYRYRPLRK